MSLPRAVLDADIIFSRVLHELMGRLAGSVRLFDLIWSEELLDEVKSSLIERKGLSVEVAEAWVGHMRREFPDGSVDLSAVPDDLDLTSLTRDLDDVHVCALAIAGNADYLFTFILATSKSRSSFTASRCPTSTSSLSNSAKISRKPSDESSKVGRSMA